MKSVALPVAVVVAIIGSVLAVSANLTTGEMRRNLEQERYKRMIAEEQLQKANNTVKQVEMELAESRSKISNIEEILAQGRNDSSEMKAKLEVLMEERDALQEQVAELQSPSSKR